MADSTTHSRRHAMRHALATVLAGLRAASSDERVHAATKAAEKADLNQVAAELEATAVNIHEAAMKLAEHGALSFAVMLASKTKAEQQATCTALRAIFNVLGFLRDNPGLANAERAALVVGPCVAQLFEGGAVESLCTIFQESADHTSAGNAIAALFLIVSASGQECWASGRLESCLNTDEELSSLLAFAGAVLQPRSRREGNAAMHLLLGLVAECDDRMRPLACPTVLSGAAMSVLVALFSCESAALQGPSVDVLAGTLLLAILQNEGAGALDALERCRYSLVLAAFTVLLEDDGEGEGDPRARSRLHEDKSIVAFKLLEHLAQTYGENDSWSGLLHGSMLDALITMCTRHAPRQLKAWRRAGSSGSLQAQKRYGMPAVGLLSSLASSPALASLIAALLAPEPAVLTKAAEMQTLLVRPERRTLLRGATPLSAAAVRKLREARKAFLRNVAIVDNNDPWPGELNEDQRSALVAQRPLLLASSAEGSPGRVRTALRRANVVECHDAMLERREEARREEWRRLTASGYVNTAVCGQELSSAQPLRPGATPSLTPRGSSTTWAPPKSRCSAMSLAFL